LTNLFYFSVEIYVIEYLQLLGILKLQREKGIALKMTVYIIASGKEVSMLQ
jgi:hypothetical protein